MNLIKKALNKLLPPKELKHTIIMYVQICIIDGTSEKAEHDKVQKV